MSKETFVVLEKAKPESLAEAFAKKMHIEKHKGVNDRAAMVEEVLSCLLACGTMLDELELSDESDTVDQVIESVKEKIEKIEVRREKPAKKEASAPVDPMIAWKNDVQEARYAILAKIGKTPSR